MAYTLGNKYAKNCCKRTIPVRIIVEDVVTFFGTQCRMRNATPVLPFKTLPVAIIFYA